MTACTIAGLSAQPPCYWNAKKLAGNGTASFSNGVGTGATFNSAWGIAAGAGNLLFIGDTGNHRIRVATVSGNVSTLAGRGIAAYLDSTGTAARFNEPRGLAVHPTSGEVYCADTLNSRIRRITLAGVVTTFAGNGAPTWLDGPATSSSFFYPISLAFDSAGVLYVADTQNMRIRRISTAGIVSTIAGNGSIAFANGVGTSATFSQPGGVAVAANLNIFVGDTFNRMIRMIDPLGVVTSFAGSSIGAWLPGVGAAANIGYPFQLIFDSTGNIIFATDSNHIGMVTPQGRVTSIAGTNGIPSSLDGFFSTVNRVYGVTVMANGAIYFIEGNGNFLRELTCVPCPASYYCFSGAPVLCPAGSYCPLSSLNAKLCPKGSFSNAGAANCTLCPAGTFASSTGSTSCQQCPGGHYCPTGTSSWARLNCGRGNYCPDGSGAPTPCPFQVPPTGGWGALQVQGPAFLVETAHCLNHCFWNFTSGDGMLSKC